MQDKNSKSESKIFFIEPKTGSTFNELRLCDNKEFRFNVDLEQKMAMVDTHFYRLKDSDKEDNRFFKKVSSYWKADEFIRLI